MGYAKDRKWRGDQRWRASLAVLTKANGLTEGMVRTLSRGIKDGVHEESAPEFEHYYDRFMAQLVVVLSASAGQAIAIRAGVFRTP